MPCDRRHGAAARDVAVAHADLFVLLLLGLGGAEFGREYAIGGERHVVRREHRRVLGAVLPVVYVHTQLVRDDVQH